MIGRQGAQRQATGSRVLAAAAVLGLVASTAAADMLQLQDGRMVDGPKMEVEGEFIVVHYENGDVKVPLATVEDYLIEGAAAFEAKTEEEKAKRAEGLVPFRGKWVKPEVRSTAIAKDQKKKRAELEEYRKHTVWRNRYQFETKHFTFQSTLTPKLNEEFSELLEAYFKEFGKVWKVRVPKDWGKLEVYMHRDLDSFHSRGGVGGGVQAYYRFVAPRELHFYYNRRDPEGSIGAMFHEANHYLADLISEEFQYPHWIGEGMAEYFSASVWDPKKKKMTVGGIQEGRLVEVRTDIDADKRYELSRLIGGDVGEYQHYYWGWSFIHFMLQSPKYAKNFKKYILDLADGKGIARTRDGNNFKRVNGDACMKAFKKRMKVKDILVLEAEWYDHIDKMDNTGLRGLEQAGMRAYGQGRVKFRATRLLKGAIEKGSKNPQVYLRYATCLLVNGKSKEDALEQYVKACEVDPLDGWSWAYRGYFLKTAMNRTDEGERLIALAKEMDPDEDYLDLEVAMKLAERASEED